MASASLSEVAARMMMVRQFPQFTAPIFPSVIARPDRNVGSDQQVSVPGTLGWRSLAIAVAAASALDPITAF